MNRLAANIRHAAAQATASFTWLPDKPMLRIAEIATATGMETTYLEEYFARKCCRFPSETGARRAMRVPRSFAMELLVSSAQFTSDEQRDGVSSLFREFGLGDLVQMRAALEQEIRRKS